MFHHSQTSQRSALSNRLPRSKNVDYYVVPDSKTNTVLIADEEPEVCDALSVALRQWAQEEQRNVKTIAVENGQQAVDYVQQATYQNPPFLAILDLRMPEINGLESAQIINELCPQMAIIISVSQDEVDEQLIKQADDFANQNSHIGFVIRTDSSPFLKVALEFEIRKLVFSDQERTQENTDIFSTVQDALSHLLNL